jgi:hypothetical protein
MRMHSHVAILGLLGLVATAAHAQEGLPTVTEVRHAIERSLPFLEREGVAWIRERGCVSCHTVAFLPWSHNQAKQRGLTVDERKVREWTNWSLVYLLARGGESDTVSQMLLGRDRASPWRQKPSLFGKTADPYERLWKDVIEQQNDDGSWSPGGQLTSPAEVTTGWTLLALASWDSPSETLEQKLEENLSKSRDRALAWLKTAEPSDSTEALLLRMLVERTFGDSSRADELRNQLLSRQNPDGGWSYRKDNHVSDAFATGQSLYALSLAGLSGDHPAIQRAQSFLLRTQHEDGSWSVSTRAIHNQEASNDRLKRTDAVYQYWGTGWATIGLLQTLPAVNTGNGPGNER